jgi:flagellar assembly factor FliW
MEQTEEKRTIKTKMGRDVEITEKQVVRMLDGLLGFPDAESFALVPHSDESPFLWLQSLDEPGLAFVTLDPRLFKPDYVPDVAPEELALVGLDSVANAIVLVVVVIPEDPQKMTANLQGPLVINPQNRVGRQMISRSSAHPVRHYILGGDAGKP